MIGGKGCVFLTDGDSPTQALSVPKEREDFDIKSDLSQGQKVASEMETQGRICGPVGRDLIHHSGGPGFSPYKPSVEAQICQPSTRELEAEGQGHPQLQGKF